VKLEQANTLVPLHNPLEGPGSAEGMGACSASGVCAIGTGAVDASGWLALPAVLVVLVLPTVLAMLPPLLLLHCCSS